MSTQPLVLVADDEPRITKLVSIALGEEGFRVVTASGGEEALAKAEEVRPDIVLLDIVMPDLDGIEVMRQLRERRPVPVILLTAKGSTADKAKGLDLGADDYIAKPFSQRLLIARIRAILRRADLSRASEDGGEQADALPEPVVRGRLEFDPARHKVTWDGTPVSLTVTEFMILEALATRPGVVKSRNQLMDAAYHDDVFVDDRTIDSHIKRLRRKFRSVDPEFAGIETLYGAGYSFAGD